MIDVMSPMEVYNYKREMTHKAIRPTKKKYFCTWCHSRIKINIVFVMLIHCVTLVQFCYCVENNYLQKQLLPMSSIWNYSLANYFLYGILKMRSKQCLFIIENEKRMLIWKYFYNELVITVANNACYFHTWEVLQIWSLNKQ